MYKKFVSVIAGSESDVENLKPLFEILKEFKIGYDFNIASAHRSPELVKRIIKKNLKDGIEVFIAAAGLSAALPGFITSLTTKPVIGIPIFTKELKGLDSLISMNQMPKGFPVATVAIGSSGVVNAGLLATSILSVKYKRFSKNLNSYREDLLKKYEKRKIKRKPTTSIGKNIQRNFKKL